MSQIQSIQCLLYFLAVMSGYALGAVFHLRKRVRELEDDRADLTARVCDLEHYVGYAPKAPPSPKRYSA